MFSGDEKEARGAWIIHHGRKIVLDTLGPADFPAIDEAAKTATLLAKLGQTDQVNISKDEVRAIAVASGFNPRHQLEGLLQVLQTKRLIDQSAEEVSVLGVTVASSLSHAADIYEESDPSSYEQASITLAETASIAPVRRSDISEQIGDLHHLSSEEVNDFLDRAEQIGFVDKEYSGDDRLLFNGNLFRRSAIVKTQKVLASLKSTEQNAIRQIDQELSSCGCLEYPRVEEILSKSLLEKLVAAGVYDLNQVSNERGSHVYITSPSAFHKFVDPMIDDCFDMAKKLVAAFTYGMRSRIASQGKITMLPALLGKLIAGEEVGPATAIGKDYRILEVERVIKLRQDSNRPGLFYMKLLKREVGDLALHVLTQGNAHEQSLVRLPGAAVTRYVGPEDSRVYVRRNQGSLSRKTTSDILEVLRGGLTHD